MKKLFNEFKVVFSFSVGLVSSFVIMVTILSLVLSSFSFVKLITITVLIAMLSLSLVFTLGDLKDVIKWYKDI